MLTKIFTKCDSDTRLWNSLKIFSTFSYIMINRLLIYFIYISLSILGTTSNLLQPEYSVKMLNTENIILSLGDVDDETNNDLEIIKNFPENPQVEEKLKKLHNYVNLFEMTARPNDMYYFRPQSEVKNFVPMFQISYPDRPYEIAVNEKHLSMLERRKNKKHEGSKKKKKAWKREVLEKAKSVKKRQLFSSLYIESPEEEDDEADLEKEYMDYLAQSKQNNVAFKYSDEGKPEETVKDVISKIVDLKTPKNCTNVTGIGVQAVECIVKNFKGGEFDKKHLVYSISMVLLVWFCIYLAIALPLWCLKGWCCCCCRCSFCFPEKTVEEIQTFLIQNPPGVYKNSNGVEEQYNPTQKETQLYDRLKRLIAEF